MACIDHIRLRVECPHHSDATFVAARDWIGSVRDKHWNEIYKGHGTPVGKSYVWSHPKGSTTRGHQPLPGGGSLSVKYGYVAGRWWVWYVFNPAQCHAQELGPHFSLLLSDGYRELGKRGEVQELHVAVDIDHAEYEQYGYLDSRLRSTNMSYSTLGTTYLGSIEGQRFIRCYDKAKQLKVKKGKSLGHPRLRVEMVVRPNLQRVDICQMENPFLSFYVVDLQALRTSKDPRLSELRNAALVGASIQHAFRSLKKKRKPVVLAGLAGLRPPWADPGTIWNGLPQLFDWEAEIINA